MPSVGVLRAAIAHSLCSNGRESNFDVLSYGDEDRGSLAKNGKVAALLRCALFGERGGVEYDPEIHRRRALAELQLLRLFGNAPLPRLFAHPTKANIIYIQMPPGSGPRLHRHPRSDGSHILHVAQVSQVCGASAIVSEMRTQASGSFHHNYFRFWITSALRPV
jgi:hypothetical protein